MKYSLFISTFFKFKFEKFPNGRKMSKKKRFGCYKLYFLLNFDIGNIYLNAVIINIIGKLKLKERCSRA